jgi:hypothetical protein
MTWHKLLVFVVYLSHTAARGYGQLKEISMTQQQINKAWRNAAREALQQGNMWTPTNLERIVALLKARYQETGEPQFAI